MGRPLSAKDKAFQMERQRLNKTIDSWRQLAEARNELIAAKDEKIKALEDLVAELQHQIEVHFNMSAEEFAEHVAREKKCSESLNILTSLPKALGYGFF